MTTQENIQNYIYTQLSKIKTYHNYSIDVNHYVNGFVNPFKFKLPLVSVEYQSTENDHIYYIIKFHYDPSENDNVVDEYKNSILDYFSAEVDYNSLDLSAESAFIYLQITYKGIEKDDIGNYLNFLVDVTYNIGTIEDVKLYSQEAKSDYQADIIDVTYDELRRMIDNKLLKKYQKYRITDFCTTYVYVDWDYYEQAEEIRYLSGTGDVEPLVVEAYTNSLIKTQVISETYPEDIIYYDITKDSYLGVSRKGAITYRKDVFYNLSTYYDWRNYKIYPEFLHDDESNQKWCYTFRNIDDLNDSSGSGLIVNINIGTSFYEPDGIYYYTPLMIDTNHAIGNNYIDDMFWSNEIGYTFSDNTITSNFYDNTIGDNFSNNKITGFFYDNTIGDNFSNNKIDGLFYSNDIGYDFYNNIIISVFHENTIGNLFTLNNIFQMDGNTIAGSFYNNKIYLLMANTIGTGFKNNDVVCIGSCTIGNSFKNNNISVDNEYGINGVDFTNATHVYSRYNCNITLDNSDNPILTYIQDKSYSFANITD